MAAANAAWPLMPRPPLTGGCTFPEDPAQSCASVRPIWSAAVDPRVLIVRAKILPDPPVGGPALEGFDLRHFSHDVFVGADREHIRIDFHNMVVRFDVTEGTMRAGPISLKFELPYGRQIGVQLDTLHRFAMFHRQPGAVDSHTRFANMLLALHAFDARTFGASLRDIADWLLGDGDWPGDGEHRKSRARRLVIAGEAMVVQGHRKILGGA